jgi:hypothetical protein
MDRHALCICLFPKLQVKQYRPQVGQGGVGLGAGAGGGSIIGSGTMTTKPAGRLQSIIGLPELEVVADDPDPSPLDTGTDDEDPPVMVPKLPPLEFGLEPEPAHPVLVVTVEVAGSTSGTPPTTKKGPKAGSSSTSSVTPPGPKGSMSPTIASEGSLAGCSWNSGAGSVAPPKGSMSPKNVEEGLLPGCSGENGAGCGKIAAATNTEISCEVMRDERTTKHSRVCSGIPGVKAKCTTGTTYNGHSRLLYSPETLLFGPLMLFLAIFPTMP